MQQGVREFNGIRTTETELVRNLNYHVEIRNRCFLCVLFLRRQWAGEIGYCTSMSWCSSEVLDMRLGR